MPKKSKVSNGLNKWEDCKHLKNLTIVRGYEDGVFIEYEICPECYFIRRKK